MSTDPLQLLPVEEWHKLKALFRNDWPRSISGYTSLDVAEGVYEMDPDMFKVYCPYGDLNNGMIAINIKGHFQQYVLQCPHDDTSKLEEALRSTRLIDWSRPFEAPFIPHHLAGLVSRVAGERNLRVRAVVTTDTFVRSKGPYDIELPQGFTFEPLSLEHVQLVDSTWPHRYPTSDLHFEQLIKAKLGYGLFENQELLGWVFVKKVGALGHLYTLEKHRRKGYGELILKLISNLLLEKGMTVLAYCVKENVGAYKMYVKLGFDRLQVVDWIEYEQDTEVKNKI